MTGRTPAGDATIVGLGAHGDGIAHLEGRAIVVPGALPGDRVRIDRTVADGPVVRARHWSLTEPSPDRVPAPCPHFGPCGGCAVQELGGAPYLAWKRERVVQALARAGLAEIPVRPALNAAGEGRRRATFAARRLARGVVLGFNELQSARIVDVTDCAVLAPPLRAALPALRALAAAALAPNEACDLSVTQAANGLDLGLTGPARLSPDARTALAAPTGFMRVSWRPRARAAWEPVAIHGGPLVDLSGALVPLPPGAFLQATLAGERALVALVEEALADAPPGPIADLYAGLGTFALPLARAGRKVSAWEGEEASVASLSAGRRAAGLEGLIAARRDLEREPLTAHELTGFAAAVLDPPRAGAGAQAAELARSPLTRAALVSCNPVSFARDAATLIAGGWRLDWVAPVDQFAWTPHVELVARAVRAPG